MAQRWEFASTFNILVGSHNDGEEELTIKIKLGILKIDCEGTTLHFVGSLSLWSMINWYLMPRNISECCCLMFIPQKDRVHHLSKPTYLPDKVPRDVLMWVNFFNIKEQILEVSCKSNDFHAQYSSLDFFAHFSKHNLQLWNNLLPITKALHNHTILLHLSLQLGLSHQADYQQIWYILTSN